MASTRALALACVLLALAASHAAAGKVCYFLHGTGVKETEPAASSFPEYWGNIQDKTPQCASHVFIHQDTVSRPFDDPAVMKAYCDLPSKGTGVISNAIVFTHSYGNAAFAAAIQHGYCDLDNSSTWYEVSGPLSGSKAANFVGYICENNGTVSEALRLVAKLLNYCRSDNPALPNEAYLSMMTSYPGLKGLPEIAAARISGAMCGVSAFGLVTEYSVPMAALSDLVHYGEPNDGMVGIDSCRVHTLGSTYTDDFYQAAINHVDATCRNGNGDFDDPTRQPCKWYSLRT